MINHHTYHEDSTTRFAISGRTRRDVYSEMEWRTFSPLTISFVM